MVVRSFSDLTTRVKRGARKTVAVVGADDAHALEAVLHAEPILDAVLIGEADAIRTILASLGTDAERFPIVVPDAGEHPSVTAAKLFHAGRANFLMKGRITSGELLKGVLMPEANLRKGTLMSHVAFFELPGYPKLLCLTDGGMCPEPTLAEKEAIVRNAVEFFHGLGYECPNVAGLCGSETVHPKIRETVEAAALQKRAEEGVFGTCRFVGPISYDLAGSREIEGVPYAACGAVRYSAYAEFGFRQSFGKKLHRKLRRAHGGPDSWRKSTDCADLTRCKRRGKIQFACHCGRRMLRCLWSGFLSSIPARLPRRSPFTTIPPLCCAKLWIIHKQSFPASIG